MLKSFHKGGIYRALYHGLEIVFMCVEYWKSELYDFPRYKFKALAENGVRNWDENIDPTFPNTSYEWFWCKVPGWVTIEEIPIEDLMLYVSADKIHPGFERILKGGLKNAYRDL